MNSNPSKHPSQEGITLHPHLQAALSSLDVNLEEELKRFQQQQKQRQEITVSQAQSEPVPAGVTSSPSQSSSVTAMTEDSSFDPNDDYLASSAELLRNLSHEQDLETLSPTAKSANKPKQFSSQRPKSWHDYLLTPLGVAGMLVFVLAGTLLSMILVDLGQGESRLTQSSPTAEQPETAPPETASEQQTTDTSEIPNRPNLAKDEFIELDVENLVETEPAAELPPSARPSCGARFYCVMVENPTDAEIQKTRQLVPDAYMRPFPNIGEVLQVGAFDTLTRAQELQKTLEDQGLPVAIYRPKGS